ncbi:hypothetical protein BGX24_002629 [Mortierella sp. AD032]|nr:hypothetical protein BGX24_002629 [Mortierella sp. AD032]
MRSEVPRERHQRDPLVTSNTAQRTPTNESVATAIDTSDKDLQSSSIDLSALRNPQYGLVEEALANYSHIEVPEGTFQLTHTNDPQSLDSVKQPTRSPQYYSTLTTPTDTAQTIDSAKQGNTYAQVALGDMYREGNGVSKDLQAALDWFSKAAEQGDAVAQYKVGTLYNQGEGVSQDFSKAEEWYLRVAKQGYASAQRSLGSLYESGQGGRVPEKDRNYKAAMEWYLKSANQRDAQAQYEIGRMFDHGIGVTQDDLKAKQWYLQAAESGHLGARERLQSPSGPVGRPQAEEAIGCRIS